MAIQLGSAYGKVEIDSSGVTRGVDAGIKSLDKFSSVATAMGNSLRNIGNSMTIGLTLPILATGAAAIQAASSYEETRNRALVVFEDMADSVVKNSDRAAETLGMSKKQYLDYASSIGAALKAGGMGIQESTALAEQAVKQFSDIGSFYEATTDDVAAAWQSAIRGQYEPIQRYFPYITDQYMRTYGTANGLISANTTTLTANQRAVILNAIALDEKLNPALNDFAETSDSFANSSKSLKANFNDALIALGQNLLPIALQVVQALNSMLTAFNNLSPGMQKAVLVFLGLVAVLGPILSFLGTIVSFIGGIAGLATTLGGMGISIGAVAAAAGTAGTALVGMGVAALTVIGPLLLIAATIALVYLAFKNNFGGITTTVQQLWFIIKYYFSQIIQYMQNAFKKINWQQIGKFMLMGIANGMLGGIPLIIMAASKAAMAALNTIKAKLGIKSPSTEFMKLGAFSGKGFQMGLEKMMDPATIAKTMAKPSNSFVSSSQNSYTMQFGNGLTLKDVDRLMEQKLGSFTRQLNKAVGG